MKVYKKVLAVLMLTLVSIGAVAQVKVVFGEKGEEKFTGKGGTIAFSQDTKGDEVTVTLTVTPDKGYTITKGDIKVYATYPPSGTRTLEIADNLTLYYKGSADKDTDTPSEKRDYTFTVSSGFGVWVQSANFQDAKRGGGAKGPDYSGLYYIANNAGYNSSTPTSNYYLVPANDPRQTNCEDAYYSANYSSANGDSEKPFLATYKTKKDNNSIWKFIATGDGYYYIQHWVTKKYVIYEPPHSDKTNRKSMHLQAADEPNTLGDAAKFAISVSGSGINIRPSSLENGNRFFNPAANNSNNYFGSGSDYNAGGLVGVFSGSDGNSVWYLEACPVAIGYDTNNNIVMEGSGNGDIYYTLDGTEPSSTNGTLYSEPFSPESDFTTIKASAGSDVSTYTPFAPLGAAHPRLIQNQNNAWADGDHAGAHYYMIPGAVANDVVKLNTTSLLSPSLHWYFLNAGIDGSGWQYYYIVNSAGQYMCYDSTNAIYMADYDSGNADKFKFRILLESIPDVYNIIPYGLTSGNMYVQKGGNDNTNAVNMSKDVNNNSRWRFVLKKDIDTSMPFEASKYYKLSTNGSADYYIVSPTASSIYATTSNSTTDEDLMRKMNWYFEKAADATDDDWQTYYYIRNAVTGEYLYYNGAAFTKDALEMRSTISGETDRYQFAMAHSWVKDRWFIVPKTYKDPTTDNYVVTIYKDNNNPLRIQGTRNNGNAIWQFASSSFNCDKPVITYDEVQGKVTITSPNNAPVYYVCYTGNTGDAPDLTDADIKATLTLYTGEPVDIFGYKSIKAIAARDYEGGSDQSDVASYEVTEDFKCAKPIISYDAATKKVTITSATSDAKIYYIIGDEGDFSGSAENFGGTLYEGPFELDEAKPVRAIAVIPGRWSSVSVKTLWDEAPHYIDKSSEMTDMGLNYVANPNFEADATIGTEADPFTGSFDGILQHISLSRPLFGYIKDATIKNVRIGSVSISQSGNAGAICNEADGVTRIYNCGVLGGTVTSSNAAAGGLVGHIAAGSSVRVVNCYNYADVSGSTYAAGIVGWNEGTIDGTTTVSGTGVRIALCMMYGKITGSTNRSPVYCGNHTDNIQKLTEYNFWRIRAYDASETPYTAYNDQLAIGNDEYLDRFPFYRHILNTHRELAAYFLFADHTAEHIAEIGHWALMKGDNAPAYPIIEKWETNTKKTTEDIEANLPVTTEKFAGKLLSNIESDGYYRGDGTKVSSMGSSGHLSVSVSINGSSYTASLPITDMDILRNDFTWGKVVLPHANEFEDWTRDYDYVCTGWEITSVTKDGSAVNTFSIPSDEPYNFTDRDNAQKDIYNATNNPYVFAQGGNYIVPYGVTAISIKAHFAKAYYLSDPYSDVGYKADYSEPTNLGWEVPTTFHDKTVYTSLSTLVGKLSETTNPNDQAIVLVGNYHHRVTSEAASFNTGKAVTIMSCDEDNNQEPDYAWYMGNTFGRIKLPPIRFDVPNIEIGMAARVNGSSGYPGVGIWHVHGWFELTENSLNNSSQFEINSQLCKDEDGHGNNRWIANSGCFVQVVRCRKGNCSKLSYIQVGGNAYINELYPGSHTDDANTTTSVPIAVTGGQVDECYMTGYKAGATLVGDMIRFYGAGGKIGKFLGSYLENPSTAGVAAKIDHANIGRFFGGGTSAAARIKGNIDITINNSHVDFYCGGPEFGDMYSGKTLSTHAIGTTFGEYYGAGFGGTSITYDRKAQTPGLSIIDSRTYDLGFTNYTNNRLKKHDTYGIGTCYKFEFIFNSNATQLVTRFYTGYAQFSLATTGNVTNDLTNCTIEQDFYGAGCQGKVNGWVTSTLTGCTINGNAFGGGFKAVSNELDVYPTTQPTYSVFTRETGLFSDFGEFPTPDKYTWFQGNSSNKNTVVTGETKIYTDVTMSDLGNVTDAISLTIDGGTIAGNVFGGGNESKSLNNTTVNIKGNSQITGDVYGGGNKADVSGSTTVNIQK